MTLAAALAGTLSPRKTKETGIFRSRLGERNLYCHVMIGIIDVLALT
jgi:hypothetical protein